MPSAFHELIKKCEQSSIAQCREPRHMLMNRQIHKCDFQSNLRSDRIPTFLVFQEMHEQSSIAQCREPRHMLMIRQARKCDFQSNLCARRITNAFLWLSRQKRRKAHVCTRALVHYKSEFKFITRELGNQILLIKGILIDLIRRLSKKLSTLA